MQKITSFELHYMRSTMWEIGADDNPQVNNLRSLVLDLLEQVEHLQSSVTGAEALVMAFRRDGLEREAERLETMLSIGDMRHEVGVYDFAKYLSPEVDD